MSDFELYGDYNEVEESPKKRPALRIIKAVALVLCFSVVALVLFRVFTFNHYPSEMKRIYFTDPLTDYYYENGGIKAETQNLRAPYDDADKGNFFCDYLIIVRDAGHLEITLRYNTSLYRELKASYGATIADGEWEKFHFSLAKNSGEEGAVATPLEAELSEVITDSFMMYRYAKLVFDGVDFEGAEWIRLEIEIDGVDRPEPFRIAIYENNADHAKFSEYEVSSSEVPKR